ncbi:MAG: ribonuclease T [Nevskiaceae bacterium]|nr:MAG: ribonuclease T [Nevskiaceae bacterium]TBR72048.1 MAG: ribonuclease T [Nevskiaceae bacterium]
MSLSPIPHRIADRFRSFLPVVVDVETGGFNAQTDALLQVAAVMVEMDEAGNLSRGATYAVQVQAFPGANIEAASLEVNHIQPDNPLRMAVPEAGALSRIFKPVRQAVSEHGCSRAVLVGHNAHFDLGFINAAVARCGIKRNPFHPFSVLDTVTLAGATLGQTVLARAVEAAALPFDSREAHSAIYDAEQTAELFCLLINRLKPVYESLVGTAAFS